MNQIDQAKQALIKKFKADEKNIFVFPFQDKTAVMHKGLYKGSYNDIMKAPKKDYEITVGKKKYDTRKGMTSELFDAFISYCKQENVTPLPYSSSAKEDGYWLWALVTGDPLTADGDVQIRRVREGEVRRDLANPGYDYRDLRVCPAVVVDLSSDLSPSSESLSLTDLQDNTKAIQELTEVIKKVFKI